MTATSTVLTARSICINLTSWETSGQMDLLDLVDYTFETKMENDM